MKTRQEPPADYAPSLRELRTAQEEFRAMLRSDTPEAKWQALFSQNPFVLSRALPLKLLPCDILPLGRPGVTEPDFLIHPGSSRSQSIHGLIELKTNTSRILSRPRRHVIKLSESASTAVAQLRTYDAEYNKFSPAPRAMSILGRSHLFVIIGMSHELDRFREEVPAYLAATLGDQVRILTYDELMRNYENSIPSSASILVPRWTREDERLAALREFESLNSLSMEELKLIERLLRDNLFIKRMICEFRKSSEARHSRYDIDDANRRFYERARFGEMLDEYGLGALDTNYWETGTDVYLNLTLTQRGVILRNLLFELVPQHELDQIAEEGWYHSCGLSASEYIAAVRKVQAESRVI